jgi:hypothetical protein
VIRIGGVAQDAFVLFVDRAHHAPGKGDGVAQCRCARRRIHVLPCPALRDLAVAADDVEPFRVAEVRVPRLAVRGLQNAVRDVAGREVGDRVPSRLEQEHRAIASDDRATAELDAHPPAEGLDVEHPLRHRSCCEKRAVGIAAQRPLLP